MWYDGGMEATEIMPDFRRNLRTLREAAGLSRAELSRRVGNSTSYVSELESSYRKGLTVESLGKLARVLGVPREALLSPPANTSS